MKYKELLKKLFSPIFYTLFLFSSSIFTILLLAYIESSRTFEIVEDVLGRWFGGFIFFTFLFLGIFLFWKMNTFIFWLEKLTKPKLRDHFRHCLFCYALIIFYFIFYYLNKNSLTRTGNGVLKLGIIIAVWSIFVNLIYFFERKGTKTKKITNNSISPHSQDMD